MKRGKKDSKLSLFFHVILCVVIVLGAFIWFQNALTFCHPCARKIIICSGAVKCIPVVAYRTRGRLVFGAIQCFCPQLQIIRAVSKDGINRRIRHAAHYLYAITRQNLIQVFFHLSIFHILFYHKSPPFFLLASTDF